MKTLKTVLLLATLTLGLSAALPQTTLAQTQAQAQATGRAHILGTTLQVLHRADLDFGQILSENVAKTATVDPRTSPDAASFAIQGSPLSKVIVDVTAPDFVDESGNALPYTMDVEGHKFDHQGSAEQLPNPNTIQTNDSGEFFIWVGGSIDVAANQPPGQYTTTITVSAEYF